MGCWQCVLSAGMRLCDKSVICKVASLKALNSKQLLLWIFDLKRTVNFILFHFILTQILKSISETFLVCFPDDCWNSLSCFVYSFTLTVSDVFRFSLSKQ